MSVQDNTFQKWREQRLVGQHPDVRVWQCSECHLWLLDADLHPTLVGKPREVLAGFLRQAIEMGAIASASVLPDETDSDWHFGGIEAQVYWMGPTSPLCGACAANKGLQEEE